MTAADCTVQGSHATDVLVFHIATAIHQTLDLNISHMLCYSLSTLHIIIITCVGSVVNTTYLPHLKFMWLPVSYISAFTSCKNGLMPRAVQVFSIWQFVEATLAPGLKTVRPHCCSFQIFCARALRQIATLTFDLFVIVSNFIRLAFMYVNSEWQLTKSSTTSWQKDRPYHLLVAIQRCQVQWSPLDVIVVVNITAAI